MAEAVGVINTLPSLLYKPAWNANHPKRSANQVLLSWLLNNLVYSAPNWILPWNATLPHLGPCHSPKTFGWIQDAPGIWRYYWSTEVAGDHTSTADTFNAMILPNLNPSTVQLATVSRALVDAATRAAGQFYVPVLVPAVEYVSFCWWRHAEPTGPDTFSPVKFAWVRPY